MDCKILLYEMVYVSVIFQECMYVLDICIRFRQFIPMLFYDLFYCEEKRSVTIMSCY